MVWIEIETRLVLAGVFGLSALGKFRSAAAFAAYQEAMTQLGRVPKRLLNPASLALVAAELSVAGGVLLPPTALVALGLAMVLLAAFTAALARAIRTGANVACACFGPGGRPVSGSALIRNSALIAVALAGLAAGLIRSARAGEPADVSAGGLLVCLLAAVVAVGAVALWDDLAELLRPLTTDSR